MEAIDDQTLCNLLENPEDTTWTSVPVLSSAALSFLPRFDPGLANLFHNFEPWEILSGGAECGTEAGASFDPVGVPGAECEVFLVWVTRAGTEAVLGGSGFDPSSLGDTDITRFGGSSLGGDDNPAKTGVVADWGVDDPEEESSLFSLSPCNFPFSDARSSSSSSTGSVGCGRSSGCDNELLDTLRDPFVDCGSVVEKSHESRVLRDADEARLSRS